MLKADPKQFKLNDKGQILYQPVPNNPLPGTPIAVIEKGETVLSPALKMMDTQDSSITDKNAAQKTLESWIKTHIETTLDPLVSLTKSENPIPEPVKKICDAVYQDLGVTQRSNLEETIAQLDPESRQIIRKKRIRLGPVLIFQPDLNKPAPVRLRALLWGLFNDKPLPISVPADGSTSVRINPEDSPNPAFYRMIGYPLYSTRAVRIDMLDRVINAVYDHAKQGQFQARHEMAEWLGCSIEDLYEILTALGHKKKEEARPDENQSAVASEKDEDQNTEKTENSEEKQEASQKPALAMFYLKKGKAFEKRNDFKASTEKPGYSPKKSGKRNKKTHKSPRIKEAGPKPRLEDSPFAVLAQLKAKTTDN